MARVRIKVWNEIGRVGASAAFALVLFSARVPAARAGQSSTADTSAKKPATTAAKTTSKTTTHKHHTSTAKTATTSSSHSASKTHTATSGKRSSRKKSVKARGQQKIDSERAQAIQEALIREHYLTGEATGTWNQSSEERGTPPERRDAETGKGREARDAVRRLARPDLHGNPPCKEMGG